MQPCTEGSKGRSSNFRVELADDDSNDDTNRVWRACACWWDPGVDQQRPRATE